MTARGVTIGLNGFEMSRTAGAGDGIIATDAAKGLQIRNGSVRGFAIGISIHSGATGFALRDLTVRDCVQSGIQGLAQSGEISSVRATNNGSNFGIYPGPGALIVDCVASENPGGLAGILAGHGSTLRGCRSRNNATQYGISVGAGSTVVNCTASENKNSLGVSAGLRKQRYLAAAPCQRRGTRHRYCPRQRSCAPGSGNGAGSGDGAGIHVDGFDNRIESNNVSDNDRGIDVDGIGNLMSRTAPAATRRAIRSPRRTKSASSLRLPPTMQFRRMRRRELARPIRGRI